MRPVALQYRKKYIFASLDGVSCGFVLCAALCCSVVVTALSGIKNAKYIGQFGIQRDHIPFLFVLDMANEQWYPPEPGFHMNSKK